MSDWKDTLKDVARHAYDSVSGTISDALKPSTPTPATVPVNGLANQAAQTIGNRGSQIDKAVDDAS